MFQSGVCDGLTQMEDVFFVFALPFCEGLSGVFLLGVVVEALDAP